MKQVILIDTFLLLFVNVKAQIGDVQQKGNFIISYDGNKEVGRFSINSSDVLLGFSSTIIVIKKSNFIISYDANEKKKADSLSIQMTSLKMSMELLFTSLKVDL
jgi:hypothetical protein